MYLNKLTLIGFLGNDAEVRTNNDRTLTIFSIATKSSYKKDGKYIDHTEWTRCVAFGKLGEYASGLKKGAHICVEGEKRSREYESQKTGKTESVTELRVSVIRNLDRSAKAAPDEQEIEEVSLDEEAA
jgi:single-strand DNA-binding protein